MQVELYQQHLWVAIIKEKKKANKNTKTFNFNVTLYIFLRNVQGIWQSINFLNWENSQESNL